MEQQQINNFTILCRKCTPPGGGIISPVSVQVGLDSSLRLTCMNCGTSEFQMPNLAGVKDPILISLRNKIIERIIEVRDEESKKIRAHKISLPADLSIGEKPKMTKKQQLLKELMDKKDIAGLEKVKKSLTEMEYKYIEDYIKNRIPKEERND